MPTHKQQKGFTLIEILIVIVIISIVTATTWYALGDAGRGRRVHAAAIQLQQSIELAQQQALLSGSVLGLKVEKHNYQFLLFSLKESLASNDIKAEWLPIQNNTVLAKHTLANYIYLRIHVESSPLQKIQDKLARANNNKPQAVILPSGGFTPFRLDICGEQNKPLYSIYGDSAGNIRLISAS